MIFKLISSLLLQTTSFSQQQKNCFKAGQQLGHMSSTQGVSAVAAVTITGSNRAYVALGDQGTFVRILQWM